MKRLLFAPLIFIVICFACRHGSADNVKWSKSKKLTLVSYGKPAHMERFYSKNLIAAKWGLTYDLLGCVVTPLIVDSVRTHNYKVRATMAAKFGSGWEIRLSKEQDIEFSNEQAATELLNKQSLNIKKQQELQQASYADLDYRLVPAKDSLTYKAYAHGWTTIKNKHVDRCFYTYLVDLKTKSVKLLSDTASNFDMPL